MSNLLPDFPNAFTVKCAAQLRGRGDQLATSDCPTPKEERAKGSLDMLLPPALRGIALRDPTVGVPLASVAITSSSWHHLPPARGTPGEPSAPLLTSSLQAEPRRHVDGSLPWQRLTGEISLKDRVRSAQSL